MGVLVTAGTCWNFKKLRGLPTLSLLPFCYNWTKEIIEVAYLPLTFEAPGFLDRSILDGRSCEESAEGANCSQDQRSFVRIRRSIEDSCAAAQLRLKWCQSWQNLQGVVAHERWNSLDIINELVGRCWKVDVILHVLLLKFQSNFLAGCSPFPYKNNGKWLESPMTNGLNALQEETIFSPGRSARDFATRHSGGICKVEEFSSFLSCLFGIQRTLYNDGVTMKIDFWFEMRHDSFKTFGFITGIHPMHRAIWHHDSCHKKALSNHRLNKHSQNGGPDRGSELAGRPKGTVWSLLVILFGWFIVFLIILWLSVCLLLSLYKNLMKFHWLDVSPCHVSR